MILRHLHIDGFGLFHDVSISDLNPHLVLVQGDNEAGKSTLLGFIRAVLFGFPRANAKDERFYPPLAGGVHGGRITFSAQNGQRFTVTRSPGKYGGPVTVEGDDGTHGNSDMLDRLLGGLGYDVFRNIFAFGLSELQSIESLQNDGVKHAIYGAGFGAGFAALANAKKRVQGHMEALFKPGGSKPLMNASLSEVEKVTRRLQDAGRQVSRYDAAMAEIQNVEKDIHTLAQTLEQHRRRALRMGAFIRLWSEWMRFQENEALLSTLSPTVTDFPEDGLARFEKELDACRRYEAESAALNAREAQLARQMDALDINAALLDQAPFLRALWREKTAFLEKQQQLPLLRQETSTLAATIKTGLALLGRDRTEPDLHLVDRSIFAREEIRSFQARFRSLAGSAATADEILADRAQQFSSAQTALETATDQFSGLHPPPAAPDPQMLLKLKQGRDRFAEDLQEIPALEDRIVRARQALDRAIHEIDADWNEPDIDRFDATAAARHRVEEFSQALADATETARIAQSAYKEKESSLLHLQEKIRKAEAARLPVNAPASASLTGVGVLAAIANIWWHWPDFSSLPPMAINAACLIFFLGLLMITRNHRHRRALQTQTIDTIAQQAAEIDAALTLARHASALADRRLSDISTEWQRHLEKMGIRAAIPPALAASLFFKHETARQMQQAIKEMTDRHSRVKTALADYIHTAGMLPELADAAIGPATALLQAVDGMIAREPEREKQREIFLRAREDVTRTRAAEQNALMLLNTARDQRVKIECETAEVTQSWQQWLSAHILPDTLSPDTALEALDTIAQILADIRRRDQLASEIQQMAADLNDYRQKAETIAVLLNHPLSGQTDQWPVIIEDLCALLDATIQNQAQKSVLESQLAAVRAEQTAVRKKRSIGQASLRALLQEAGAPSEADFRHRTAAFTERRRLLIALSENENNLRRITGETDVTALKAELTHLSLIEVEALEREQAEAVSEITLQVDALRNKRAALDREIATLSSDEEIAALRAEEARLRAEIQTQALDWCRYALTGYLLERAGKWFENENQPHVLKDAAVFFKGFTKGRYTRLVAPMGEETICAVTSDHRSIRPEALSRGTAEQLYLAIRFGLIRHRARHDEPLPVIMDDILVNFDPNRAQAAAEAIAELAQTHQVLFFTCHPETVERFQRTNALVQVIDLSRIPPRTLISEAAQEK